MPFPDATHRHPFLATALVIQLVVLSFLSFAQPPAPTAQISPPPAVNEFEGNDTSTGDTVSAPQSFLSPAVGKPESRQIPPLFFGLQMHSLRADPAAHKRAAETAAHLGARFVRDECPWNEVERKKGVYKIPDAALENLRTNKQMGLQTLIILDYANPLYDNGNAPASPEAVEAFGQYCFHMAKDLKDLCRYFEVWNEPNTDGFWHPKKDPKAYAHLMETAIREVRRGNPDAVVFGGALSMIDGDFMSAVCDATDCTKMDVFSIHPYCTPQSPGQAKIFEQMNNLRLKIFSDPANRRPLWVTEIGYPTNQGGGVGEWRQAEVLAQTYLLGATRPEMEGIVWYWMGPDGPDASYAEDRFGLLRPHYKGRKPAAWPYDVLSHLLPGMTASTVVQQIPNIHGSRIIRFRDPNGGSLTALYVEKDEYSIDILGQNSVEVIPLDGATPQVLEASAAGPIQVNITPMPVLIRSKEPLKIRKSKWAQFLYARSSDVARGGSLTLFAASRQPVKKTHLRAVVLWPGSLQTEQPPFAMPWTARDFDGGDAAETVLDVAGNEPTQRVPVAAYWVPPKSHRPAARLSRNLTITNPVTIDIRGLIGLRGNPVAGVAIANETDRPLNVDLRIHIEGREGKSFQIASLRPGSHKVVTVNIDSLPSPDAVLEVDASAKLSSGVEVKKRNFVSFMFSPKLSRPLAIDGRLADWPAKVPPIQLGNRNQIVAERQTWGGPNDDSAHVWTAWDNDWFYIGAEVYDDIHVEEATGFTVYNNDGLEVYIDSDREKGRNQETYGPHQFQYGLFPSQGEDVLYEFHHFMGPSPGGHIKINRSPKAADLYPGESDSTLPSMILEAAIPMKEILLQPKPGMELGFTVALNDDDTPGVIDPFSQDLQMQWSRQRNAWQHPASFASLWLVGTPKEKPAESKAESKPGKTNGAKANSKGKSEKE